MFVTFLRFAENRTGARDFMPAHNDWIAQGFGDGGAAAGGAILAHGESRDAYDARIAADPSSCKGSSQPKLTKLIRSARLPSSTS